MSCGWGEMIGGEDARVCFYAFTRQMCLRPSVKGPYTAQCYYDRQKYQERFNACVKGVEKR